MGVVQVEVVLRSQYRSAAGEVLLDQTDVGAERRLSVLGSYFVRKSDFRDGLIKSVLSDGDGDGDGNGDGDG